jgi:GNAT superfamily N-acetyltransferase
MTFRIREADLGDADLETFTAIVNETTPDDPTSVDEMRWSTATYPGTSRFILEADGRPVGTASVGRIYVYPPDFDAFWATVNVLADSRRQGFGAALLAAVSERALAAGKVALHVPVSDGRPDGVAFFLHRGFREHDRNKTVHLELTGFAPPAVELPAGVSLTTLAERPDLIEGVHAVAIEAFADIPGGDTPMAAGDLEEFRKRDVDRPSIPPAALARLIRYRPRPPVPITPRRMRSFAPRTFAADSAETPVTNPRLPSMDSISSLSSSLATVTQSSSP